MPGPAELSIEQLMSQLLGELTVSRGETAESRGEMAVSREETAVVEAELEQLKEALQSARCIGMAMGILMARHSLPEQQAFEALKVSSRNQNRKLRDVADAVVLNGEL